MRQPPTLILGKFCTTEWLGRGSEIDGESIQYADQHYVHWLLVHPNTIVCIPILQLAE